MSNISFTQLKSIESNFAKNKPAGVLASPLLSSSSKGSAVADLVNRQYCPSGIDCGPGLECTAAICDYEDCADAPVCQGSKNRKRSAANSLMSRQFKCPPGLECGVGPVCTAATCGLSGCADAPVCQGSGNKKRNAADTLVSRQFDCPPGIECGHGPECTTATCDLPGCADAEVCQDNGDKKRSADTDIVHPVCDICIVGEDGIPVCGCATAGKRAERRGPAAACPEFCIVTEDGETLCGCAAEDYEESGKGTEPVA